MSLHILFEDNHCLVLCKPAPLMTQAPEGVPSLEAEAKEYLRAKYAKKGRVYLGIPHRLDRPVSGVVLFARQTVSAQRLAEQFETRKVTKIYWALLAGRPEPGTWEDWLRKAPEESRAEVVQEGDEGAKKAVMDVVPLRDTPQGTLVEFRPQTGRMHQIRIQSSLRGHPIHGDVLYGSTIPFGPLAEAPKDRVIALHARSLTFLHPIRFEPITVEAPLPEYWSLI